MYSKINIIMNFDSMAGTQPKSLPFSLTCQALLLFDAGRLYYNFYHVINIFTMNYGRIGPSQSFISLVSIRTVGLLGQVYLFCYFIIIFIRSMLFIRPILPFEKEPNRTDHEILKWSVFQFAIKFRLLIQFPMLKKQTVTQSENKFSITPKSPQCYFLGVSAEFKAPFNLNKASNSIVPAFLNDGLYFTPSFILPREKEYYQKNKQFNRINFEERITMANSLAIELQSQKTSDQSLGLAIPDISYCQICKQSFINYLQHIKSLEHSESARSSPTNQYIWGLCQNYRKKQTEKTAKHRVNKIRKQKTGKLRLKNKILSVKIRVKREKEKSGETRHNNSPNGQSQLTIYF